MKVKYIQAYVSESVTCNIFDKKNGFMKKIEHQIHKNKFEELFYHYYTTAVSTYVCLVQISPFTNMIS